VIQNTCKKGECYWWGLTDGKCPNFIESWWKPSELNTGQPVLVADCAPIRTFLMVQELYNRLVGVQAVQEEMRNENVWVQAVAEILGRAANIDIESFVRKREQIIHRRKITGESEEVKKLEG